MSTKSLDASLDSLIEIRKKGKGDRKGKGRGKSDTRTTVRKANDKKEGRAPVSAAKLKQRMNMSLEEVVKSDKSKGKEKGKGASKGSNSSKGNGKGNNSWSKGKGKGNQKPAMSTAAASQALLQAKRRALLAKLKALESVEKNTSSKGSGKKGGNYKKAVQYVKMDSSSKPSWKGGKGAGKGKSVYVTREVQKPFQKKRQRASKASANAKEEPYKKEEKYYSKGSRSDEPKQEKKYETQKYAERRERADPMALPKSISGFKGSGRVIRISNCPVGLNKNELRQAFGDIRTVNFVEVVPDKKLAFLVFEEPREAHEAENQFDGGEINGCTIKITVH